jgi:hypothetical protein
MDQKIWGEIVDIYLKCKYMYIKAEEWGKGFCAPLNYLASVRDAFDLTVRVIAGDIGLTSLSEEEKRNLPIAVRGHLRRAFFDICDFLSTRYREMIKDELLAPYSSDVIAKVIPKYYEEYCPFVYSVTDDIMSYRMQKGLHNAERTDYKGYMDVVDKLDSICKQISSQIPVLEDLMQQEKAAAHKKKRSDLFIGILAGVIASAIFAAIMYVWK